MRTKRFFFKEAASVFPLQAFFGRISTEVDVGSAVEITNVPYKLRFLMKKRINKRVEVVRPEGLEPPTFRFIVRRSS